MPFITLLSSEYFFSQNLQSLEFGFSQDFDSSASILNTSRSLADTATHHNISCVNDLSLMSQIYLKYNDYLHNDRLKRLLNQWNRQEKLKVSYNFSSTKYHTYHCIIPLAPSDSITKDDQR